MLDRRALLKAAGASLFAASPPLQALAASPADAVFATCCMDASGAYAVALLSEDAATVAAFPLPGRGHDIVFDAMSRRAVVFARRPGLFAVVFDPEGSAVPLTIVSPEGRHFFGHGVFSPDGRILYATENEIDTARGMIGIYDASGGFRRIGEFPTHGMDPHEVLLMPDGRTLAIANGGIETHPDFGRAKLNLATMQPSLVFVDREDGRLLARHMLPPELHQLSLRHMDLDASGALWFGCQYEGAASDRPPLIGRVLPDKDPQLVDLPPAALASLRNYVGSVAANPRSGSVAFSSPQGNALLVLDAASGDVLENRAIGEVCGIAPGDRSFFASTGDGRLLPPGGGGTRTSDRVWDNHILRLG